MAITDIKQILGEKHAKKIVASAVEDIALVRQWVFEYRQATLPADGNGSVDLRRPRIALSAVADEFARPGAIPECIATAQKRSGRRVDSSAAMPAPADSPAIAMRARSTGCVTQTCSIAASIVAASRWARPPRVSNQFQQPCAFDSRSCSG